MMPRSAVPLSSLGRRAIFVARERAAIYDVDLNRWIPLPGHRFPHGTTNFPSEVLQIAPVTGGALLVDRALNRFSSAERFLERFIP
jgi:hypothetical protein